MSSKAGFNRVRRAVCSSAAAFCGLSQAQTVSPPPVLPVLSGSQSAVPGATVSAPTNNGYDLQVNQTAAKAILNWDSFNIGVGSKVRFVQPDTASIALNRVTGSQQSVLEGQLSGNGQVWLLNPNGVLIGSGGSVDTRGFLATTRSLGDADFIAGRYGFKTSGLPGAIVNQGRITASDGGYAVLAGEQVSNQGLIQANLGTVVLGGANEFTVDLTGDRLLSFVVNTPVSAPDASSGSASTGLPAVVENTPTGNLIAKGGTVLLTAQAVGAVLTGVINTQGLINASRATVGTNGQVVIDGGSTGWVQVGGTVSADGKSGSLSTDAAIAVSGGDVLVNGRLQKTGSENTAIRLAANGRLELFAGAFVGGADAASRTNISVLSNSGATTSGGIRIASGASVVSFGGDILLAGGKPLGIPTDPGNPASAVMLLGFAANLQGNGIEIGEPLGSTASLSATLPAALIDAGGGSVTLRGQGGRAGLPFDANNSFQGVAGVALGNGAKVVTQGSGAVSITGYAQAALQTNNLTQNAFVNSFSYKGVVLGQQALVQTESGAVTVLGKGGGDITLSRSDLTALGGPAAPATLSGVSSSNNLGIELNGAAIRSNSGNVALFGKGGGNLTLTDVGVYSQGSAATNSADGLGSGYLGSFVNHGIALFNSVLESTTGRTELAGISGGSVHASGLKLGDSASCATPGNTFCNSSLIVGYNSGVLLGFDSVVSGGAVLVRGRSLADIALNNASLAAVGSGNLSLIGNAGVSVEGGRMLAFNGGDLVLKGVSESNLNATGFLLDAVAPSSVFSVNSQLNTGVSITGSFSASTAQPVLPSLQVTGLGNMTVAGEGAGLVSIAPSLNAAIVQQASNHGVVMGMAQNLISPATAQTSDVQTQALLATPVAPIAPVAVQADSGRIAIFAGANDTASTDLAILSGTTVGVTNGTVALRANSLELTGAVSGGQNGEQNATLVVAPRTVGVNLFLGDGEPDAASAVLHLKQSVLQQFYGFGRMAFGGEIDSVSKDLQVFAGKVTVGIVGQGSGQQTGAANPAPTPAAESFIGVFGRQVDVQQPFEVSSSDRIFVYGQDSLRLASGVAVSVGGQLDLVTHQFLNAAGSSALLRTPGSQGVWRIWTPDRTAAGVDAVSMAANGLVAEQEIFSQAFTVAGLGLARSQVLKNSFIYAAAPESSVQSMIDQLPEMQQASLASTLTQVQQLAKPVVPIEPPAVMPLPKEAAKPVTAEAVPVAVVEAPVEKPLEKAAEKSTDSQGGASAVTPVIKPREPAAATVASPLAVATPEARSLPEVPTTVVPMMPATSPVARASIAVVAPPPSPVGEVRPATPRDLADNKDAVLANASPLAAPKPAQQARRSAGSYATTALGGAGLRLAAAPRLSAAATMEYRFSLMGNPSVW